MFGTGDRVSNADNVNDPVSSGLRHL